VTCFRVSARRSRERPLPGGMACSAGRTSSSRLRGQEIGQGLLSSIEIRTGTDPHVVDESQRWFLRCRYMGISEDTAVQKIQRMFRQHDEAPEAVESPLYRQLTQEWVHLNHLPSTSRTLRHWARNEPVLAGFQRPGDIVDAIDQAANEGKDQLLLALVRTFQAGQQLAGRIIVQALLPKLAKLTQNGGIAPRLSSGAPSQWREDCRHIAIAELWRTMADYPAERRTQRVAANLVLDTLHIVTGVQERQHELPFDPTTVDDHAGWRSSPMRTGDAGTLPGPTADVRGPFNVAVTRALHEVEGAAGDLFDHHELASDPSLIHVILWALRSEVITHDEAQLLTDIYVARPDSRCGYREAADRLGLTAAATRQRCSRVVRRLTSAVQQELVVSDAAVIGAA
jgi:hypothetical protein